MEKRLINLVREYRILYDKREKGYRDTTLKETKWNKIAAELDISVIRAKQRWKSLRDRFRREYAKVKSMSGHETFNLEKIHWKFFRYLLFLKDIVDLDFKNSALDTMSIMSRNEKLEHFDVVEMNEYDEYGLPGQSTPLRSRTDGYKSDGYRSDDYKSDIYRTETWKDDSSDEQYNKVENEFSDLLQVAKKAFHETTPVKAFFNAMALQVEHANLPFHEWARLQQGVIGLISESVIRCQRDET